MKDLEKKNARLCQAIADLTLDKLILQEAAKGNCEPRAPAALHRSYRKELPVSERRVCRVLGQHRLTQCKVPRGADNSAFRLDRISGVADSNLRALQSGAGIEHHAVASLP